MNLYFIFLVAGALLYVVVDGFLTGAVWVRGSRSGFSLRQLGHKRSREDDPVSYWIFMTLYMVGVLGIVLILLII